MISLDLGGKEKARREVEERLRSDNAELFGIKLARLESDTATMRAELVVTAGRTDKLENKLEGIGNMQQLEIGRLEAVRDRVKRNEESLDSHSTKLGGLTSKTDSNENLLKERPTTGTVLLFILTAAGVLFGLLNYTKTPDVAPQPADQVAAETPGPTPGALPDQAATTPAADATATTAGKAGN